MGLKSALPILILAAVLEASGDYLMGYGLHKNPLWQRRALCALAIVVLGLYGWAVNKTTWKFSDFVGIYVVCFFFIAQLISWFTSKKPPSLPVCVGGILIIAGGAVIAVAAAHTQQPK